MIIIMASAVVMFGILLVSDDRNYNSPNHEVHNGNNAEQIPQKIQIMDRVPPYPYYKQWAMRVDSRNPFALQAMNVMVKEYFDESIKIITDDEFFELCKEISGSNRGKAAFAIGDRATAKNLGYWGAFSGEERNRLLINAARDGDSVAQRVIASYINKNGLEFAGIQLAPEERSKLFWAQKAAADPNGPLDAKAIAARLLDQANQDENETALKALAETDFFAAKMLFEEAAEKALTAKEPLPEDRAEMEKWKNKIIELTGATAYVENFIYGVLNPETDPDQPAEDQTEPPKVNKQPAPKPGK